MKAIIFNTEKEAKELNDALTNGVKGLFDKNTFSYSYVMKHPEKELFCVPIDEDKKYFPKVKELININDLVELPSDWFNNEDF